MCPRGSFKNRLHLLNTNPESPLYVMGPSRFHMLPPYLLTGIVDYEKSAVTLLFVCTSLFPSSSFYTYICMCMYTHTPTMFLSTLDIQCYSLADFRMLPLLLILSTLSKMYLREASSCFFHLSFLELPCLYL